MERNVTCVCPPGDCQAQCLIQLGVECRVLVERVGLDVINKARAEAREYLMQLTGLSDDEGSL